MFGISASNVVASKTFTAKVGPYTTTQTLGGGSSCFFNDHIDFPIPQGVGRNHQLSILIAGTTAPVYQFPLTVSYAPPTINSIVVINGPLAPTDGTGFVDLVGENFGAQLGPTTATIGGLPAPVVSASHSFMRLGIPAGSGTNKPIILNVGGQLATTSPTLSYAQPSISSITPFSVPTDGGTTITINGSNFGTSPQVTIGGTPVTIVSSSPSSITALTPPVVGLTIPVVVTVGGASSNILNLSSQAPFINSISPASGPTAGGAEVLISGGNFGGSLGTAKAFIGNNEALITSRTHSAILMRTPPGQGFTETVRLQVGGQTAFGAFFFTYSGAQITTVTAPAGLPTSGGTPIEISGSNFGLTRSVSIGGVNVPITSATHTRIKATLPAGSGTNKAVIVTVAGLNSGAVFLSYDPPVIYSIQPASGPAAGGTTMTLSGNNFGSTPPVVTIGGQNAPVLSSNHKQITVQVPAGSGSAPVNVVVAGQPAISPRPNYTYQGSGPVISNVSAPSIPTSGGTGLSITGSNFGGSPTVLVGTSAASVVFSTSVSITATLPAGIGTSVPVVVNSSGQFSNAAYIDYDPPFITSINPVTAGTAGGTTVVVSGLNFGVDPNLTSLLVGGRRVTPTVLGHGQIQFSSLPGEGTNLPVVLTVGDRTTTSNVTFSYSAPVITSVSPPTAPTQGGTTITVLGVNLGLDPILLIGGVEADIIRSSHTFVEAVIPPGVGVNKLVQVSVGGQMSNTQVLSYQPPTVGAIEPSNGPTSGGTTVTIFGTNFGGGQVQPLVTVGGLSATVLSTSHTQLSVLVPPGQGINAAVQVIVSGNASTGSVGYRYNAPVVNSVSGGPFLSGGGQTVTINGSSFGLSPSVTIDGNTAPLVSSNHTQIQCTLPPGSGADQNLVVTVGSQSSNAFPFDYAPPVLSGVSPTSGTTVGGTAIVLSGTSLGGPSASSQLIIGGRAATIISSGHSVITALTPPGEGTSQTIQLIVEGQVSTGTTQVYHYNPPAIDTILPASGPTAGGTTVTLQGSNFGQSPIVILGGVNVVRPDTASNSQITFVTPPGIGTQSVQVQSAGQLSNSISFNYGPPTLSSLSPPTAGTAGGTFLTLAGTNFGGSVALPTVTLNGTSITVLSASHTSITCTLPAGQGINLPVQVIVGSQPSATLNFSYAAPSLATVMAGARPTAGGVPVSIVGNNFGLTPTVTIGGNAAPVSTVSHTSLTVTLPPGSGLGNAVVVTVGGQSGSGLTVNYDPPTIVDVSPRFIPSTGGTTMSILGTNFGPPAASRAATIGGAAAPVLFASHTDAVLLTPVGTGSNQAVNLIVSGQGATTAPAVTFTPFTNAPIQPAGDAPPTAPNPTGVIIDYADGSTSGGVSQTTVTVRRGAATDLSNIPQVALSDLYWEIHTDRTFTSATVSFLYDEALLGLLREGTMVLYTAPTPSGPWTPVSGQQLQTGSDTIYGFVSHFSWFALAGPEVPVGLSRFELE